MARNRYNFTLDSETVEILKEMTSEKKASAYVCEAVKLKRSVDMSKAQPVEAIMSK